MHRATLAIVLTAAGILAAAAASASQPAGGATKNQQSGPSPALLAEGAAIAREGIKPSVAACESCHGTGGGAFPLLSAQPEEYITRQLADFRNGKRNSPMMSQIAKAMTEQQMNAVAAHYSRQAHRKAGGGRSEAEVLQRGGELALIGDAKLGVTGCDTCHGTDGQGGDFPALAGQNPAYIAAQIKAFRDGTRTNDSSGLMQAVAKALQDADAKAVGAYYRDVRELVKEVVEE